METLCCRLGWVYDLKVEQCLTLRTLQQRTIPYQTPSRSRTATIISQTFKGQRELLNYWRTVRLYVWSVCLELGNGEVDPLTHKSLEPVSI